MTIHSSMTFLNSESQIRYPDIQLKFPLPRKIRSKAHCPVSVLDDNNSDNPISITAAC